MELIKEHWTKQDGKEFQQFLKEQGNPEKIEWATRLLNTKMPVLVIPTPKIKKITEQIYKGNFLEFLDLNLWEFYENTAINGTLIMKINDFEKMVKYLKSYAEKADNWATCDLLYFNVIKENNKKQFFELSKEFIKSEKPFVRRIGMNILFKLINDKEYLFKIFEILNGFEQETEYYVNMVNAWLIAECFVKQREATLNFLKTNKLNKFTVNKAVQKCRDSFRVSKEDKEMLLKYKR